MSDSEIILWFLQDLKEAGPDLLEIYDEWTLYGETENGQECYSDISISEYAGKAADLIEQQQAIIKELLEAAVNAKEELDDIWRLYGENLQVANYHLNGDLEPMDCFFEESDQQASSKLDTAINRAKQHLSETGGE